MKNQGFVTDSDTERELREWQQARDMPIDVEKIRQQYKNKQNNAQGQHFEREMFENTDVLPYQIEEMKVTIANLQARVKKLEDWQE